MKYDAEKTRIDLLPFIALECVGVVLRDGSVKYAPHNWRKGIAWTRLTRAAIGHLFRFASGENYDRETGLPHLAHAACCVLFLLEYFLLTKADQEYEKFDNRYVLSERVLKSFKTIDDFREPKDPKEFY